MSTATGPTSVDYEALQQEFGRRLRALVAEFTAQGLDEADVCGAMLDVCGAMLLVEQSILDEEQE